MENQFKGTQGKWEVRPTQAKQLDLTPLFHDITIKDYHFISTFRNDTIGIDSDQAKANAKLISCAPEMLEMLIDIRQIFDKYLVSPESQIFKYKEPLEQLIKEATNI